LPHFIIHNSAFIIQKKTAVSTQRSGENGRFIKSRIRKYELQRVTPHFIIHNSSFIIQKAVPEGTAVLLPGNGPTETVGLKPVPFVGTLFAALGLFQQVLG
jgi:hypothetical protein